MMSGLVTQTLHWVTVYVADFFPQQYKATLTWQ
jgi:hypothetical protein